MRRQRNELIDSAGQERVGTDEKRTGILSNKGCEAGGNFLLGAGALDLELEAESALRFVRWLPNYSARALQ